MSETRYVTPKGKDERRIPYPIGYTPAQVNELKRRGIFYINYNGVQMAQGPGMTTEFYDEIARGKRDIKSAIIAMLGPPGTGKSWSGLRLCQIIDKKFDVRKQVIFTRQHFMDIISGKVKIPVGSAILIDEAHFGLGARSWWDQLQQDLVNQIAAIRSQGIILIFVILHLSMLDKIIRQYVLNYQLHMESRGILMQYKVFMPRFKDTAYHPKVGKIGLSVPGVRLCGQPICLKCKYKEDCLIIRAEYERLKKVFLYDTRETASRKADDAMLKDDPLGKDELRLSILYENKDKLTYTRNRTIKASSVIEILSQAGIYIADTDAGNLGDRVLLRHPELRPLKEEGE